MTAETACRPIGIPTFAHFHGYDITARLRKRRYRNAIQNHWHPFAGMICVGQYQCDYLLEQGYDPASVALIPCGAPTREIKQKTDALRAAMPPRTSERDSECHFVFIGRFVEKKDPVSLVKAFTRCFQFNQNARLNLAGFGPLEQRCRDWIDQQPTELQQAIRMTGALSPDQVLQELVNADVYVQHSRVAPDGDKEGWPVVIAEAMAAKLPIVSTRHAGIVDQVVEGESGFLSDEGDWETMGDNMARIAGDRSLRQSMAECSQQRMMQFDANGQIEQLREFMLERIAIAQHKRRAA
jgi:glycosyltransferase involved in cell wall biosynthesis